MGKTGAMRAMMKRYLLLACVVLACAGRVPAQETPRALIQRVVQKAGGDLARPLPGAGARMPKFFDEDARRGETWAIYWHATGKGLPAGATVLFEYQLNTAPGIRSLHQQYDFVTRGDRKVSFTIPEQDYREGGNVKTWRVRIIHSGQLLAERAAPNWTPPPAR